jgi:hypothetical protein
MANPLWKWIPLDGHQGVKYAIQVGEDPPQSRDLLLLGK